MVPMQGPEILKSDLQHLVTIVKKSNEAELLLDVEMASVRRNNLLHCIRSDSRQIYSLRLERKKCIGIMH